MILEAAVARAGEGARNRLHAVAQPCDVVPPAPALALSSLLSLLSLLLLLLPPSEARDDAVPGWFGLARCDARVSMAPDRPVVVSCLAFTWPPASVADARTYTGLPPALALAAAPSAPSAPSAAYERAQAKPNPPTSPSM